MQAFTIFMSILATATSYPYVEANTNPPGLEVTTDSGVLTGIIDPSAPHVRHFLGIPYALPPTEARRWLPPTKKFSGESILATSIGPACPQQLLRDAEVYSVDGGNMTEFFPLETLSEDCLTLNVWTPEPPRSGLPVIIFFFGGHFIQGGTNSRFFDPQSWLERTQEHIVITVNFRSNIFGFPMAPGLDEQNLGLLDQRLAPEWVRDNIDSFGGDPAKMTLWGESSGAIATDFLNFAYPSDPIVGGMILASNNALFPIEASVSFDTAQTQRTAGLATETSITIPLPVVV